MEARGSRNRQAESLASDLDTRKTLSATLMRGKHSDVGNLQWQGQRGNWWAGREADEKSVPAASAGMPAHAVAVWLHRLCCLQCLRLHE